MGLEAEYGEEEEDSSHGGRRSSGGAAAHRESASRVSTADMRYDNKPIILGQFTYMGSEKCVRNCLKKVVISVYQIGEMRGEGEDLKEKIKNFPIKNRQFPGIRPKKWLPGPNL